jgi:hypothetical protein
MAPATCPSTAVQVAANVVGLRINKSDELAREKLIKLINAPGAAPYPRSGNPPLTSGDAQARTPPIRCLEE